MKFEDRLEIAINKKLQRERSKNNKNYDFLNYATSIGWCFVIFIFLFIFIYNKLKIKNGLVFLLFLIVGIVLSGIFTFNNIKNIYKNNKNK